MHFIANETGFSGLVAVRQFWQKVQLVNCFLHFNHRLDFIIILHLGFLFHQSCKPCWNICNTLNLAVLVITESKLDETIPTNLITIPGYHEPVRRDRNRNGGGVLIYIAEYLVFQQLSDLQSPLYEHI